MNYFLFVQYQFLLASSNHETVHHKRHM